MTVTGTMSGHRRITSIKISRADVVLQMQSNLGLSPPLAQYHVGDIHQGPHLRPTYGSA
jgi:hypothetical protein